MMKLLPVALLAALLPLAGCVSPSDNPAYAGYDPNWDSGEQGYDRLMEDEAAPGPVMYAPRHGCCGH